MKTVQFRDVLQEMNSKGKLGRGKKTASRHRPEAEVNLLQHTMVRFINRQIE